MFELVREANGRVFTAADVCLENEDANTRGLIGLLIEKVNVSAAAGISATVEGFGLLPSLQSTGADNTSVNLAQKAANASNTHEPETAPLEGWQATAELEKLSLELAGPTFGTFTRQLASCIVNGGSDRAWVSLESDITKYESLHWVLQGATQLLRLQVHLLRHQLAILFFMVDHASLGAGQRNLACRHRSTERHLGRFHVPHRDGVRSSLRCCRSSKSALVRPITER
jgi:hypothetical protein